MNISNVKDCYGCGVCALACARGIIEIKLDADGFYAPVITDAGRCTDCGLCLKVCSYADDVLVRPRDVAVSYAAWSNDRAVRASCSSGGAAFEVARSLMARGFKVCGVRFDAAKGRAVHYVASTVEELRHTAGSKYIQSFTVDGLRAVNRKEPNLVIGTPCQIDSYRRYLRLFKAEDNFILMDFFCHGVPSMLLFDKYIREKAGRHGRVSSVTWRDKAAGWHDSWAMTVSGTRHAAAGEAASGGAEAAGTPFKTRRKWSEGDAFFRLFLSDQCLGKACYERCKFKYGRSSADIRIGDLWGDTYAKEDDGVTAVAVFSDKGREAVEQSGCHLTVIPFETAAEGQMKASPKPNRLFRKFRRMLRDETVTTADMTAVLDRHALLLQLTYPLRHPLRMTRNIIFKRILRIKK